MSYTISIYKHKGIAESKITYLFRMYRIIRVMKMGGLYLKIENINFNMRGLSLNPQGNIKMIYGNVVLQTYNSC